MFIVVNSHNRKSGFSRMPQDTRQQTLRTYPASPAMPRTNGEPAAAEDVVSLLAD
jgi:hypothetical protein